GPHRLAAMALRRSGEVIGDDVERVVPGDRREALGIALGTGAAQRLRETLRVMLALGIARDLAADDAGGVGMPGPAVDAADRARVDPLHRERAHARSIMRADGVDGVARHTASL